MKETYLNVINIIAGQRVIFAFVSVFPVKPQSRQPIVVVQQGFCLHLIIKTNRVINTFKLVQV